MHARKVTLAHDVVRTLPRRAHGLPRKAVAASQRWRLLEGLTEVTARLGYATARVADVIVAAGVSRKTFYEYFKDKEDCFLTAYDVLSERLVQALVAVGEQHANPADRRGAQVAAFLRALAKEPAAARVFMVDVLGAGPRALKRRERVNARFGEVLLADVDDPVRRAAIVGGVNNVVGAALLNGRGTELAELAGPLAAFVEDAIGKRTARAARSRR